MIIEYCKYNKNNLIFSFNKKKKKFNDQKNYSIIKNQKKINKHTIMGSFFIFTDDKKYFQLYFDDIRGPNFEFNRLFIRYDAIFCGQLTCKIE